MPAARSGFVAALPTDRESLMPNERQFDLPGTDTAEVIQVEQAASNQARFSVVRGTFRPAPIHLLRGGIAAWVPVVLCGWGSLGARPPGRSPSDVHLRPVHALAQEVRAM